MAPNATDDSDRDERDVEVLRRAVLDDDNVPERVRAFLASGAALEAIRLHADGRWSHRGEDFVNERLSALFHRSVERTPAGNWLLRIAPYTYPILVVDAGWFADRMTGDDAGAVLHLRGGETIAFTPDRLETDGDTTIAQRRVNGGRARLMSAAYQRVLDHIDLDDRGRWVLRWAGRTHVLDHVARG